MYKQILVALDGSEFAEKIVPYVEALAKQFGSSVTLVRATMPAMALIAEMSGAGQAPMMDPTPILEAERQETETYLSAMADRLKAEGIAADYKHPEGTPAEVILELARQPGVDLIAMTTHGRGGLQRAVLGSVADAVLRHAPCPVLLVRVLQPAGPHPAEAA